MTNRSLAHDPNAAARTAKNAHAALGLPNQPKEHSKGRNLMVGTPATHENQDAFARIAQVMGRAPQDRAAYVTGRDYEGARLRWLFDMADALRAAGCAEDAESVRKAALQLVHDAVNSVAGGTRR